MSLLVRSPTSKMPRGRPPGGAARGRGRGRRRKFASTSRKPDPNRVSSHDRAQLTETAREQRKIVKPAIRKFAHDFGLKDFIHANMSNTLLDDKSYVFTKEVLLSTGRSTTPKNVRREMNKRSDDVRRMDATAIIMEEVNNHAVSLTLDRKKADLIIPERARHVFMMKYPPTLPFLQGDEGYDFIDRDYWRDLPTNKSFEEFLCAVFMGLDLEMSFKDAKANHGLTESLVSQLADNFICDRRLSVSKMKFMTTRTRLFRGVSVSYYAVSRLMTQLKASLATSMFTRVCHGEMVNFAEHVQSVLQHPYLSYCLDLTRGSVVHLLSLATGHSHTHTLSLSLFPLSVSVFVCVCCKV